MADRRITVCPECGSRRISTLKNISYFMQAHSAVMGRYTCLDCGYEGFPFELDSMEDYKKFLELKKEEKRGCGKT